MTTRSGDFTEPEKRLLAQRASYICSNPECHALNIAADPGETSAEYIGEAAHIHGAQPGSARHKEDQDPDERSSALRNGVFLCRPCARRIDLNNGASYPPDLLWDWRTNHETWTRANLNKDPTTGLIDVTGTFEATGIGNVTAIDVASGAIIRPGTRAKATGVGDITALKIRRET